MDCDTSPVVLRYALFGGVEISELSGVTLSQVLFPLFPTGVSLFLLSLALAGTLPLFLFPLFFLY